MKSVTACFTPTLCFFPVAHNAFYIPASFWKSYVLADVASSEFVEKAELALKNSLSKQGSYFLNTAMKFPSPYSTGACTVTSEKPISLANF